MNRNKGSKKRGRKMRRRCIGERMRFAAYAILLILAIILLGVAGRYECEDIDAEAAGYEEERVLIQGHPTDLDPEDEAACMHEEERQAPATVLQMKEAWIPNDTPELDALYDQFEELCQGVMDEGGNTETELGIRYMADGILNRVDSELFPDNIHDVIWQKGQFACTADFYKWVPTEKVIRICAEEVLHRTNTKILYWRTDHYHAGTTPIAHEGHHYYSGR